MDGIALFPIWIFDFLSHDVWYHDLEYLSGICRGTGPQAGSDAALDLQAPMALGISRDTIPSRRCSVRLRLLQRDAHLHRVGPHHHGAVQAPQLVRILPHGHHDPADMQGEG